MEGIKEMSPETKSGSSHEQLLDCEFIVGAEKKKFYCFQNVLTDASSKLATLVNQRSPRSPVIISDVDPYTFEHLVRFLYTDKLPSDLTYERILSLLDTASQYAINNLVAATVELANKLLTPENACFAYQSAIKCDLRELRNKAMKVICSHTLSVVNANSFLKVTHSTLLDLVQQPLLNVSEEILVTCVHEWARIEAQRQGFAVNQNSMRMILGEIVSHLRVLAIPLDVFAQKFLATENAFTMEEKVAIMANKSNSGSMPFPANICKNHLLRERPSDEDVAFTMYDSFAYEYHGVDVTKEKEIDGSILTSTSTGRTTVNAAPKAVKNPSMIEFHILFSVDRDINIVGVRLQLPSKGSKYLEKVINSTSGVKQMPVPNMNNLTADVSTATSSNFLSPDSQFCALFNQGYSNRSCHTCGHQMKSATAAASSMSSPFGAFGFGMQSQASSTFAGFKSEPSMKTEPCIPPKEKFQVIRISLFDSDFSCLSSALQSKCENNYSDIHEVTARFEYCVQIKRKHIYRLHIVMENNKEYFIVSPNSKRSTLKLNCDERAIKMESGIISHFIYTNF